MDVREQEPNNLTNFTKMDMGDFGMKKQLALFSVALLMCNPAQAMDSGPIIGATAAAVGLYGAYSARSVGGELKKVTEQIEILKQQINDATTNDIVPVMENGVVVAWDAKFASLKEDKRDQVVRLPATSGNRKATSVVARLIYKSALMSREISDNADAVRGLLEKISAAHTDHVKKIKNDVGEIVRHTVRLEGVNGADDELLEFDAVVGSHRAVEMRHILAREIKRLSREIKAYATNDDLGELEAKVDAIVSFPGHQDLSDLATKEDLTECVRSDALDGLVEAKFKSILRRTELQQWIVNLVGVNHDVEKSSRKSVKRPKNGGFITCSTNGLFGDDAGSASEGEAADAHENEGGDPANVSLVGNVGDDDAGSAHDGDDNTEYVQSDV